MKPPVHSVQPSPPDHLKVQRLKEPRFSALYNINTGLLEQIKFVDPKPSNIIPLEKKALAAVKQSLLKQVY